MKLPVVPALILLIFLLFGLTAALFWSEEIKEAVSANLPELNLSPNAIPDFKKWPVKKEGNVDVNSDGRVDFKLVYYLKEKEDAVALFVPLQRDPYLLIFSHSSADLFNFDFEDKIFYAVFENGKWEKTFASDKRVEEEFKRLNIKTAPLALLLQAMLSGFNKRDSVEPKNDKDDEKSGPKKKYRM